MATLLEGGENGADGEDTCHLITGSELVIAGGIPRNSGDRRFTCFGNDNPYFELVELSLLQSDAEEESENADRETHGHNGLSMDTNVPKMLKQAMIISSDSDNMQEMKIKPRETMNISKFVTDVNSTTTC